MRKLKLRLKTSSPPPGAGVLKTVQPSYESQDARTRFRIPAQGGDDDETLYTFLSSSFRHLIAFVLRATQDKGRVFAQGARQHLDFTQRGGSFRQGIVRFGQKHLGP